MQNSLQAGTLPVDLNGAFHRQIPLDQKIKEEEIKATYKEGILRIELP
ncbi:MAG TPA: Hsp20/alpha crystallin family protein [Desulfohalobiaceae bacterium]|nr:Hsp20/alpha crystallin family protein [Desulfohalobiaceae bacterium]